MFCHKCGTEIVDGSAFCHKCGAQIPSTDSSSQVEESVQTRNTTQVNHANEQNVVTSSVKPVQVQSQAVVLSKGKTEKKKPGKIPLILGTTILAAAIFVVVRVAAGRSYDDASLYSGVSLSQTYTNKAEGLSFQYPSAWKPSDPEEYYSTPSDIQTSVTLLINKTGQSSLSISIYTSWEETSIGTIGMYIGDEWYYLGEITAEPEKDVYLVETDTGEEVVLDVHSGYGAYLDYGIIVIDLYMDGQYIDEYTMVEHYES